jgi:hypothetical protein
MNTQTLLNLEPSNSQDNSSGAQSATPTHNGNGSHSPRPPIIHLGRSAHVSWCGKDLDFYANAISKNRRSLLVRSAPEPATSSSRFAKRRGPTIESTPLRHWSSLLNSDQVWSVSKPRCSLPRSARHRMAGELCGRTNENSPESDEQTK